MSSWPQAVPAAQTREVRDLRLTVVSDAGAERNGVGTYYRDLVDHLRAHTEHVECISPRFTDGRWSGGLILPMPGDPTQRICVPPVWSLAARIRASRPQVIVVPTPGPYGLTGAFTARRLGIPLVTGFHTHFEKLSELYGSRLLWRAGRAYFERVNRLLFRRSAAVLANSVEMADIARRLGAARVELMGTPVARVLVETPVQPLGASVSRILFAGRLAAEKRVPEVLEATTRLPALSFAFAGDGPLRAAVQRRAREQSNVDYLGWLDRPRLMAAMDQADVLVLPSQVESFGTIALEGMARGRLVLVSGQCGIVQWPELKGGLFRILPGESVQEALVRLAALDPGVRRRRARKAREAALELNTSNLEGWLALLSGTVTSSADAGARGA